MAEHIGLLGTGLVGSAITRILLAAGYQMVVWNRTAAHVEPLVQEGAARVDCPAEVAERCRRVFISVMTTDIVARLTEGPDGLLSASTPPVCIIDTTTGDPDQTADLARRLQQRGVMFLDAPISGSSAQIAAREGLYMVGGCREAFEACEDLLQVLTEKYIHVGPSGSGSRAKLASNVILGLNRLALAEGLVFAEALGLEPETFLQLLKMSPAYSVAMDVKGGKMLTGDFTPQARLAQHHKDLSIVMKHARALGQQLPLTQLHLDIMEAAIEAGEGDLDNSVVICELRRRRT